VANPVSLSAVAAGDLKTAFRVILRKLRKRRSAVTFLKVC
jgi:hypothetical protein